MESNEIITKDIKYIGVNDHDIDLFEGQYQVENGMAYNSYLIFDEKIAVMDTVDQKFGKQWLDNLSKELGDKQPDFLLVHHMEPDHSANIANFIAKYPKVTIVTSAKAVEMMKNFFDDDFAKNFLVIKEGDSLNLGKHILQFIAAPMVHWPEVVLSYDLTDKILFSADAFGKFGALDIDDEQPWGEEARRYYIGIVGKYGAQVQALLKKVANIQIKQILPLHGPFLSEDLSCYIDLYNTWSSYDSESDEIFIAYTSVYGHTEKAVQMLADKLEQSGYHGFMADLARVDMSECVAQAFRVKKIVLATTTYNADIFPFMKEFINNLVERNFQNKTIGFIENGSWAPVAANKMKTMLATCKNIDFIEPIVSIKSAVHEDTKLTIEQLVKNIIK